MAFFRVVSMRKPVQTVASEAGTSSQVRVLLGQGQRAGEHHRQAAAGRSQQERSRVAHQRVDFVADVGLAHGMQEEPGDHESLQARSSPRSAGRAGTDLRLISSGKSPAGPPGRRRP